MATTYATGTLAASASGQAWASWDLLAETAFDRVVSWYLNDQPLWRNFIDKRPVQQAMPGDVVTLTLHSSPMTLVNTTLTENVDPDTVAPPTPTRVNITLNEYGNASLLTLRLKETGFTQPDAELAMHLAINQADSLDALVRAVADSNTNKLWVNGGATKMTGGADASVAATDYLLRAPATTAVKRLRSNKVHPKVGSLYLAVIHPDVSYDLQAENSATAWTAPHTYGGDTEAIYSGAVGTFQGAQYIETTRVNTGNVGAAGAKVYSTYFLGREAIAEAVAVEPHTVIGPQIDRFKRFFPIGWYGMLGWSVFRPVALLTARTSSSIAGVS